MNLVLIIDAALFELEILVIIVMNYPSKGRWYLMLNRDWLQFWIEMIFDVEYRSF